MTGYAYVHVDSIDTETEMDLVQKYAGQVGVNIDEVLSDTQSIKKHWSERLIGEKLTAVFQPGDHLFVYEASQLACSTSQLLEIMNMMADKNIHLYFIKYNMHMENASQQIDTQQLLNLVSRIESDFISKRTMQALARRKAAGLPLGRPKGRVNKSLKLDKHRSEIKKYVSLGISKASIAKLVDCHPQTLYDWLERNNLEAQDDNA